MAVGDRRERWSSAWTGPEHGWGVQGDCWVGTGALRGAFKLKQTLLREKLLLVKLQTEAESPSSGRGGDAPCHADGRDSCGHTQPPACQVPATL